MAQDRSGGWYWYDSGPVHSGIGEYWDASGKIMPATGSGVRNPEWRDTLEQRPHEAPVDDGVVVFEALGGYSLRAGGKIIHVPDDINIDGKLFRWVGTPIEPEPLSLLEACELAESTIKYLTPIVCGGPINMARRRVYDNADAVRKQIRAAIEAVKVLSDD